MLAGILITHAIWCVGTWVVWCWVRRASKGLGRERIGVYQTAIMLVGSMKKELGSEMEGWTEKELSKRLGGKEMDVKIARSNSGIEEDGSTSFRRRGCWRRG